MRSKMRRYRPKKMPGHKLVQMQNLHREERRAAARESARQRRSGAKGDGEG